MGEARAGGRWGRRVSRGGRLRLSLLLSLQALQLPFSLLQLSLLLPKHDGFSPNPLLLAKELRVHLLRLLDKRIILLAQLVLVVLVVLVKRAMCSALALRLNFRLAVTSTTFSFFSSASALFTFLRFVPPSSPSCSSLSSFSASTSCWGVGRFCPACLVRAAALVGLATRTVTAWPLVEALRRLLTHYGEEKCCKSRKKVK